MFNLHNVADTPTFDPDGLCDDSAAVTLYKVVVEIPASVEKAMQWSAALGWYYTAAFTYKSVVQRPYKKSHTEGLKYKYHNQITIKIEIKWIK